MSEADQLVATLAEGQHGVVSRRQARLLGMSREMLRHRLARGEWSAVSRQVVRRTGMPITDRSRLMAAVLAAPRGAAAGEESAAALWGVPGFNLVPARLIRPRATHWTRSSTLLPEHHVTVKDGIPVTTPARTIFDLAGRVHPKRAEQALENALRAGILTLDQVRAVFTDLAGRGRGGTARMREFLEARPAGYVPTGSGLEDLFLAVLARSGIPLPRRQVNAGDDEAWIGRVDFVDAELPIAYEVNSGRYHGRTRSDRLADATRYRRLTNAGLRVVDVWEHDLLHHPGRVVARVTQARRTAAHPHLRMTS